MHRLAPPPPPSVPHAARPSCDTAQLQSDFSRIQEVCCAEANQDCNSGPPRVCVPHCQEVIADFWSRCETLMQSLPDGFSQVDEFVSLCSSEKGGGVSTGVNSALASLKDTQPDMRFTCSYTELTGIALQCSTVTAPTTPANRVVFCASNCASQLIPFHQQCSQTMQVALATFGLTDTVNQMLSQCGAGDDSHACPIGQITAVCGGLENPSGGVSSLCATQCLRTVSAHYDACSASTDPETVAKFSAQSWKPLVDACHNLDGTSSAAGQATEVTSQCLRIQNAMTTQLSTLCCRDSLCSTMPSSCTAECTDALIPYFRDCAAELLVHSPALMGRLTELANACSAGGH